MQFPTIDGSRRIGMVGRRRLLSISVLAVPALLAACSSPPAPTAAPVKATEAAKPAAAAPTTAAPAAAPAAVATKPAAASPGASAPPAATAATKPADAAKPTGKKGGTVNFAVTSDPLLNPMMTGDVSGVVMTKLIFNGLVRPDRVTLEPRPDLAVSWEATENGSVWTFKLRDGVKWHDGAPFTAEDVKFTFDSILDPKVNTVLRGNYRSVKSVDVVDPKTVKFALTEPFAAFPTFVGHLGTVSFGVIPKHILQGVDLNTATSFNKTNPVGTGPFKMKEFKAADHVTLVAYDDYHFGRPLLDTFNWKIIPDTNTSVAQVRTGELTVAQVTPAQAQPLKSVPEIKVEKGESVRFSYLGLNKSRKPLDDLRVRKALMFAIDREALIKKIWMDEVVLAHGPIPPTLSWAYEGNVTKYGFDPAKSKALLAEAGWVAGSDGILAKDGTKMSFKLTASRSPVNEQQAAQLQQWFKAVGIETTIELLEFGVFIKDRRDSHNYDMMLHGWLVPPDPDQFNYWHSSAATGGGLNAGEYKNPEADKLLEDGRKTLDKEKRKEIYSKLQKLMADDLPELWLWYTGELRAVSKQLVGLGPKSYYDVELHYANEWSLA